MFLELQPKIKNRLLEEYNQKALARIAMSQILLQLQKKHKQTKTVREVKRNERYERKSSLQKWQHIFLSLW